MRTTQTKHAGPCESLLQQRTTAPLQPTRMRRHQKQCSIARTTSASPSWPHRHSAPSPRQPRGWTPPSSQRRRPYLKQSTKANNHTKQSNTHGRTLGLIPQAPKRCIRFKRAMHRKVLLDIGTLRSCILCRQSIDLTSHSMTCITSTINPQNIRNLRSRTTSFLGDADEGHPDPGLTEVNLHLQHLPK